MKQNENLKCFCQRICHWLTICLFPKVLECGEEKILTLTEVERFKALAAQFVKLLRSQKDNCLMMTDLLTEYAKTFGYTFRLQDYDVSSVSALTQKLCHVVKVNGRFFHGINVWCHDPHWDVCVRLSIFGHMHCTTHCVTACFGCRGRRKWLRLGALGLWTCLCVCEWPCPHHVFLTR